MEGRSGGGIGEVEEASRVSWRHIWTILIKLWATTKLFALNLNEKKYIVKNVHEL